MICDELLKLRSNERLELRQADESPVLLVTLARDKVSLTTEIADRELTPLLLSETLEHLRRRHDDIDAPDAA